MHDVSTFRLYILRATYLLIVVGLGLTIWPLLLDAPETAEHFRGVYETVQARFPHVDLTELWPSARHVL